MRLVHALSRRHGLAGQDFQTIEGGGGRPEDARLLLDLCDNIEGKSFCPLGRCGGLADSVGS
jgi:NADH:ubiquinone oxidoreductase subunit F (NADH-binding)